MKQQITETMFKDAFRACGRNDQFSYAGLSALYDFLEEVDEDMELDVIAICCDFSEYNSGLEAVCDLGYDVNNTPDLSDMTSLEWLRENTCVIEFTGGIIIQSF